MTSQTFKPRGHVLDLSDKKPRQMPAQKMTTAQRDTFVTRMGTVVGGMTPADEWAVLFVVPKDGAASPAVMSPGDMPTETLVNVLAALLGHAHRALVKEREAAALAASPVVDDKP